MLDLLFDFTEWLRGTFLLDLAFWITETSLNQSLVTNFWVVPIAQVIHIIAIAAAFGATLMLTLRINDAAGATQTVGQVSARYVPWIWWGLLGILVSGLFMITAEPIRNMVNAVFWIKMGLLVVTIAVTLAFQGSVRAKAAAAGPVWKAGGGTRMVSILILVLWCLIMVCGRWIAYVPV
jgi:hypothetical protein